MRDDTLDILRRSLSSVVFSYHDYRALQYTTLDNSALLLLAPGVGCRATARIVPYRPHFTDWLWRKTPSPAFVPSLQTPAGARNHRAAPSDPRAGLRRPGRFIRTPGDPANSLWARERRAETQRDPRPDGSPILWAMAAANVDMSPHLQGCKN